MTFYCEANNTLQPLGSKGCGGVSCNGQDTHCPAFTDARECF
ncbi:hypothetical protein [Corallococcus sp. RDP092CA]